MSFKTGDDCIAYTGSALLTGTDAAALATPTWTPMNNLVGEPSVNGERPSIELSLRGLNDVLHRTGKRRTTIDFVLANDGAAASRTTIDVFRNAFNAAVAADRVVAVAFCDGDITEDGTEVVAGNFEVTAFNRAEPIDGNVAYNVSLVLYSNRVDALIDGA